MPKIVPIVEGKGDEKALPLLLRKILCEMNQWDIQIAHPNNAHGRSNLIKEDGLEKFIRYALKETDRAAILVLVDADADCAKEMAEKFAERVGETTPTHQPTNSSTYQQRKRAKLIDMLLARPEYGHTWALRFTLCWALTTTKSSTPRWGVRFGWSRMERRCRSCCKRCQFAVNPSRTEKASAICGSFFLDKEAMFW